MLQKQQMLSERQKQQITELQQKQQVEMVMALQDNVFPAGAIPSSLNVWLAKALRYEKQGSLQCDWKILRSLFLIASEGTVTFSLQQFGFACNCIEDKTAEQLQATNDDYVAIQDTIQELATKWKEIVGALHEPIKDKYKKLIEMIYSNKPIIMPG